MQSVPKAISIGVKQAPDRMELQCHQESTAPPEVKAEKSSFKKLVQDFMEYTTAHGIGRLDASQTLFWKIFWSLICISASGMFMTNIVETIP